MDGVNSVYGIENRESKNYVCAKATKAEANQSLLRAEPTVIGAIEYTEN